MGSRVLVDDVELSNVWYHFCLSGFVIGSLLLCWVYFWKHREGQMRAVSLGAGFAGGAIKSWVALVAAREDLYPTLHGLATLAFVFNSGVCCSFLVKLEVKGHTARYDQQQVWYLGLCSTFILTATYFGVFYTQSPSAWAVEQLGLFMFSLSQLTFFWFHPFTHREAYTSVCNSELYSMVR